MKRAFLGASSALHTMAHVADRVLRGEAVHHAELQCARFDAATAIDQVADVLGVDGCPQAAMWRQIATLVQAGFRSPEELSVDAEWLAAMAGVIEERCVARDSFESAKLTTGEFNEP